MMSRALAVPTPLSDLSVAPSGPTKFKAGIQNHKVPANHNQLGPETEIDLPSTCHSGLFSYERSHNHKRALTQGWPFEIVPSDLSLAGWRGERSGSGSATVAAVAMMEPVGSVPALIPGCDAAPICRSACVLVV